MHTTKENIQILFEDNHIIAVNKRAGDIVQGDKTGDAPLSDFVKAYIKEKYKKPGDVFLGTVHRIDRPTSGVVLFARTSKSLERLNKLFKEKDIKKTYYALVEGTPKEPEQKLVNRLAKNAKLNKSQVVFEGNKDGKEAILNYNLVQTGDKYSLLKINLETGRHHQIRVQLSHAGSIIKGDLKYGAKRSNKDGSICLHAGEIEFLHPVTQHKVLIKAPFPTSETTWQHFKQ